MNSVTDRLRDADPLRDDDGDDDHARDRIRRAVAEAAASNHSLKGTIIWRRRVLVTGGSLIAALVAISYLGQFGARNALQAAVRFEMRLAERAPVAGLIVAGIAGSNELVYLHPEPIVTNDDIAQSWVTEEGDERFGISVQLLEAGTQRVRRATASHIGRPVAILIDGAVVMAPVVRSPIGDTAFITGDYTRAQAERIAAGIGAR